MTTWQASTHIGPYVLVEQIGAGGMGEVWKARDPRVDRTVAIKRLKPEHAERFRQEARAIASQNHPHICQLYDVGDDYLVMEYVDGTPLRCPQPAEHAVRLASTSLRDAWRRPAPTENAPVGSSRNTLAWQACWWLPPSGGRLTPAGSVRRACRPGVSAAAARTRP